MTSVIITGSGVPTGGKVRVSTPPPEMLYEFYKKVMFNITNIRQSYVCNTLLIYLVPTIDEINYEHK